MKVQEITSIGVKVLPSLIEVFKAFPASLSLLVEGKLLQVLGLAIWLAGLNGFQRYFSDFYYFFE